LQCDRWRACRNGSSSSASGRSNRCSAAARRRAEFPRLLRGKIERFELEQLGALNFVMDQALEGGVNLSLNLDSHGKSWSFLLLGLEVEIEG
jgi:hypothetical protein